MPLKKVLLGFLNIVLVSGIVEARTSGVLSRSPAFHPRKPAAWALHFLSKRERTTPIEGLGEMNIDLAAAFLEKELEDSAVTELDRELETLQLEMRRNGNTEPEEIDRAIRERVESLPPERVRAVLEALREIQEDERTRNFINRTLIERLQGKLLHLSEYDGDGLAFAEATFEIEERLSRFRAYADETVLARAKDLVQRFRQTRPFTDREIQGESRALEDLVARAKPEGPQDLTVPMARRSRGESRWKILKTASRKSNRIQYPANRRNAIQTLMPLIEHMDRFDPDGENLLVETVDTESPPFVDVRGVRGEGKEFRIFLRGEGREIDRVENLVDGAGRIEGFDLMERLREMFPPVAGTAPGYRRRLFEKKASGQETTERKMARAESSLSGKVSAILSRKVVSHLKTHEKGEKIHRVLRHALDLIGNWNPNQEDLFVDEMAISLRIAVFKGRIASGHRFLLSVPLDTGVPNIANGLYPGMPIVFREDIRTHLEKARSEDMPAARVYPEKSFLEAIINERWPEVAFETIQAFMSEVHRVHPQQRRLSLRSYEDREREIEVFGNLEGGWPVRFVVDKALEEVLKARGIIPGIGWVQKMKAVEAIRKHTLGGRIRFQNTRFILSKENAEKMRSMGFPSESIVHLERVGGVLADEGKYGKDDLFLTDMDFRYLDADRAIWILEGLRPTTGKFKIVFDTREGTFIEKHGLLEIQS